MVYLLFYDLHTIYRHIVTIMNYNIVWTVDRRAYERPSALSHRKTGSRYSGEGHALPNTLPHISYSIRTHCSCVWCMVVATVISKSTAFPPIIACIIRKATWKIYAIVVKRRYTHVHVHRCSVMGVNYIGHRGCWEYFGTQAHTQYTRSYHS